MTANTGARPVRLQLSRKAGFRLQEHSRAVNGLEAVKVDRTTPLGNPFVVGSQSGIFDGRDGCPLCRRDQAEILVPSLSLDQCLSFYRDLVSGFIYPEMFPFGHDWMRDFHRRIGGHPNEYVRRVFLTHNAACWCRLCAKHKKTGLPVHEHCPDCEPCHADVLLQLANPDRRKETRG